MPDTPSNDQYVLKFLSGTHVGAEVAVDPGEYLIGTDDACDIVLSDQLLCARHARLFVSPAGITVTPLEGTVLIEEQAVGPEPISLAIFQIFSLGGTHCRIGPGDGPWPAAILPDLVPKAAAGLPAPPAATMTDHTPSRAEPIPSAAEFPAATAKPAAPEAPRPSRWLFGWALAVIVLLAAVGGLAFTVWNRATPSQDKVSAVGQADGSVRAVIKQMGLESRLTVTMDPRQGLIITGYLKTDRQKQDFAAALTSRDIPATLRVVTVERILTDAREIMMNRGVRASLDYQDTGILILSGEVADPREIEALAGTLSRDVAGVHQVENQTVPARAPEPVVAKPAATAPPPPSPSIPVLSVRSVNLGQTPFLVLSDGRTYLVGGLMDNDMVIQKITADAVIVLKDGQEITYNYKSQE